MNLQNLLDQFMGVSPGGAGPAPGGAQGIREALDKLSGNIPGGVVGGAATGAIMALLMGNKSARKFVGKAATYGGCGPAWWLGLQGLQELAAGQFRAGCLGCREMASHSGGRKGLYGRKSLDTRFSTDAG